MSAVSQEWDLSIAPALAKLQELLKGVDDTMAKMAAAVSARADESFAPLGEASKNALSGMEGSGAPGHLSAVSNNADRATAAMRMTAGASQAAGAGMMQAGHGAQTASAGFSGWAGKAMQIFHVAGVVGHGISGMKTIVETAKNAFNSSSPVVQGYVKNIARITAVAGGAAAGVWAITRAWRAWGASSTPRMPSAPRTTGGAGSAFNTGLQATGGMAGYYASVFGSLFSKMGPLIAAGLATAGIGGIIGKSMSVGKEEETRRVKFEAIVGDTGKAKAALAELRDFANIAPGQEFGSLVNEAKNLVTQGYGIENIVSTIKRVGDVATGSENSVAGLAKELMDIQKEGSASFGKLSAMEAQGIPIVEALAKSLGKTPAQIQAMASAAGIAFPQLMAAWDSMSGAGGRFEGAMARISGTSAGAMERLSKEMHSVFAEIGQPINDVIGAKLQGDVQWAEKLHEWAKRIGAGMAGVTSQIIATYQVLSDPDNGALVAAGMSEAFQRATNVLYAGLMGSVNAFAVGIAAGVEAGMVLFEAMKHADFWAGISSVFIGIAAEFQAAFLRAIAAGMEAMKSAPGMTTVIGDTPDKLRKAADYLRESTKGDVSNGASAVAPYVEQMKSMLSAKLSEAQAAFEESFKNTPQVFDVQHMDSLKTLQAKVNERAAAAKAAADLMRAPVVKNGLPGSSSGGDTRVFSINSSGPGAFAQAVNLLMGRSVNEMILAEHQKTNDLLEDIKKNTSGKTTAPDPTPRFT